MCMKESCIFCVFILIFWGLMAVKQLFIEESVRTCMNSIHLLIDYLGN